MTANNDEIAMPITQDNNEAASAQPDAAPVRPFGAPAGQHDASLATGSELTPVTFADFIQRLRHHVRGEGVSWHHTADALFTVQARKIIFGIDRDYTDKVAVAIEDCMYFTPQELWDASSDETRQELDKMADGMEGKPFLELANDDHWDHISDLDDHTVSGWDEQWEFVNAHFTKEAAEAFIQRKKHDYPDGLRVYVDAQVYCWEFNAIIKGLLDGQIVLATADQSSTPVPRVGGDTSYGDAGKRYADHVARQRQESAAACAVCGGTGVVDDGEIDCYPNGEPFTNGPVKCVKDCPSCATPSAAVAEGVDTAEMVPVIIGGKFYYTAEMMTTYGAQQREAGRRELRDQLAVTERQLTNALAHATRAEAALARQPVSEGLTPEQIVEITRPFWNEKIRWFDVVGLYRFLESRLSAVPPAKAEGLTFKTVEEFYLWGSQGNSFAPPFEQLHPDAKASWKRDFDSRKAAAPPQIDLRALYEKLVAAKYAPKVARGLHLKNRDGSFQVTSIEQSYLDWRDGYRAALAQQAKGEKK